MSRTKKREQFVVDYDLVFLRIYPGLVVITSGIGSRKCVKWEAGVRKPVRDQLQELIDISL